MSKTKARGPALDPSPRWGWQGKRAGGVPRGAPRASRRPAGTAGGPQGWASPSSILLTGNPHPALPGLPQPACEADHRVCTPRLLQ